MRVRLDVSQADYQISLNYKKIKNVFFYITIIYYRYEETKNPDMILFNHIWVFDSDGKKLDDNPSPVGCIPNVKSFIVKTDGTFEQFYATDYADESGSVTEVSHTYETPVDFNNCKIQCWKSSLPNITYVEIVTADGINMYMAAMEVNPETTLKQGILIRTQCLQSMVLLSKSQINWNLRQKI